uniref:PRA1 family protein n=1 Tax=Triticum urartu TaxID=4572 RepID=A0A8R7TYE2_TRIUA
MDGRPATADDVVEAMREFVWFPPPRPASEFFSRFSAPRSCSKWISRLECNLYYYGTNYFILILLIGMSFLQKPVAILTAFATGLSIAFFSDSSVRHGRPSMKGSTHICGRPLSMWVFALFLFEVSCIFWASSCNFLIVPWALYVGLLVTLIHASFRERNLKGRLNRFRKEFREAW